MILILFLIPKVVTVFTLSKFHPLFQFWYYSFLYYVVFLLNSYTAVKKKKKKKKKSTGDVKHQLCFIAILSTNNNSYFVFSSSFWGVHSMREFLHFFPSPYTLLLVLLSSMSVVRIQGVDYHLFPSGNPFLLLLFFKSALFPLFCSTADQNELFEQVVTFYGMTFEVSLVSDNSLMWFVFFGCFFFVLFFCSFVMFPNCFFGSCKRKKKKKKKKKKTFSGTKTKR